jgi:hypothetical protein
MYSLREAGFSEVDAFNVNISLSCCYLIGGVACWGLLSRFGRSTIYMGGLASMFVCLIIIGSLGAVQSRVEGASLGIGIVLVIMTLFNMVYLSPFPYAKSTLTDRLLLVQHAIPSLPRFQVVELGTRPSLLVDSSTISPVSSPIQSPLV